ncbi:MAG: alpha/beta hydrolase [Candidatus Omnitrophota bacterium]|nr:alpha/beta hydrolase [Candidatus Omnitrophota bacterium]
MLSAKSNTFTPFRDKSLTGPVRRKFSNGAGFKYIDRGKKDSIALIPGWATDYRIFSRLDLKFNYLIPVDFSPFTFEKSFFEALKENNITRISLLGWSLGGFLAAEIASKHTRLIDRLVLVSIRKKYKKEELKAVKKHLRKSRRGYLYRFYTRCFSEKGEMSFFRKNLLKDYCDGFNLDYLFTALDYLKTAEIKPELLKRVEKVKIIHGEFDKIAPIREAMDIKNGLPQAEFITIDKAGHMPFFKDAFKAKIC